MALYALLDFDTLKKYDISIEEFIKTAKGLKAKILQYRDKNSSFEEKLKRIKKIRKLWKKTLIINDEIDLLPFADGIHIGQEDLVYLCEEFQINKIEMIELLKNSEKLKIKSEKLNINLFNLDLVNTTSKKIVGLSTHNKEEIIEANKLPLDYIGLGAYRPTTTKDTNNILGKKVIDLIKYSYHPVAIIGGVKIYDKIPANFKVVGSDICKLMSSRLRKKEIFKKKLKSL
ncbi:thiamine phosphate synthase [Caminibacter mediatlanticus TB-2]|uniref:Thiamine phosphate synthase n=1 Tax=Caminibacter mediatlanticus TB-2 TaxID=391592 RepID=A0ABX5V868_9BACT|nr:thiamine phosphate synthase [Caminibacter mediatlanticus]QCT93809.1 thiamine phosphate synthase [Caminibacter mediatlanticus TB-2]